MVQLLKMVDIKKFPGISVATQITINFYLMLIPPKRLFNIETMKTVMYEDVIDDVKENGYIAISHVWGDQTLYDPEELGIKGGVSWKVPFSDPKKMHKIKVGMESFKPIYCWLDVVCMPQDKQDEINLEIPFMGDYYAGAGLTFVLSDEIYPMSDNFSRWNSIMDDIINNERNLTGDEVKFVTNLGDNLLIPTDAWFTRVWTLQEAVLSRVLVLVDKKGSISNLSLFLRKLYCFRKVCLVRMTFGDFADQLLDLQSGIESTSAGRANLASISSVRGDRNCYKVQDKFYGMLGILGYKDFVVDYNINPEELNKKIVQYAYSKGDLGWMSVMGSATSFIQPMYEESKCIGENWSEDKPGSCGLTFEDDALYLNVCTFAKITYAKKFVGRGEALANWCIHTFKDLGFSIDDIADVMASYIYLDDGATKVLKMQLEYVAGCLDEESVRTISKSVVNDDNYEKNLQIAGTVLSNIRTSTDVNICKAISFGEEIPLLICGNVNVGDDVMMVRMHDDRGRSLGIVSSGSQRKSVFLYKYLEISDDDVDAYYLPHKFML
jgi:hypothetical protein